MPEINIPFYNILSDEEIEQIHQASLQVLDEIGVKTEYRNIRNMLHNHDCVIHMAIYEYLQ